MLTTARTPYRTAPARANERVSWMSRRVRVTLVAVLVLSSAAAVVAYVRFALGQRDAIERTNYTLEEVHDLHRAAVAWRAAHPLACPTLVDLGVPAGHSDAWRSAYGVECTTTTTTIRSAGPDRAYFTSDDILTAR